ncbi:MAG: Stealth CR1 domain-containing protein [Bacteroidales bacterium]|nr:Stealth CR1 domain-containing protein [Bacteroidales bacterium]
MNHDIDFVILWVDGNSPEWISKKNLYLDNKNIQGNDICRFRDWDLLKYWFRSVENFAPWVRKIHFVTDNQIPEWLNTENEKINIVNHSDIIDKKYLPLFNSSAIEINIHKIKDLNPEFVYFNDDTFIIKPVTKETFFKKGKPCDSAILSINAEPEIGHRITENMSVINKVFNKKQTIVDNFDKWINIRYGKYLFRTLFLLPWNKFSSFIEPHQPQPFLKSIFFEVWEKENKHLEKTMNSRFRSLLTSNIWLFRSWQLVSGEFYPKNVLNRNFLTNINEDNIEQIEKVLNGNTNHCFICLNDAGLCKDYEKMKTRLGNAFLELLPTKSSFEK